MYFTHNKHSSKAAVLLWWCFSTQNMKRPQSLMSTWRQNIFHDSPYTALWDVISMNYLLS